MTTHVLPEVVIIHTVYLSPIASELLCHVSILNTVVFKYEVI